jgi:hypothetical protein
MQHISERFAFDIRIELVTPFQGAQIPRLSRNASCYRAPISRAKLTNQPAQDSILLRRPRPSELM